METAVRQSGLQWLGEQLQQGLKEAIPHPLPLQIRCGMKDGALLVLAQHSPGVQVNQHQTFETLTNQFNQLQEETEFSQLNLPAGTPVRIYLRQTGQPKPYAAAEPLSVSVAGSSLPAMPLPLEEPGTESPEELEAPPGQLALASTEEEDIELALDDSELDEPMESEGFFPHIPRTLLAAGAALGLISFLGTLYVLTRPCVIGGCAPLQTAQQLSQSAMQKVQQPKSAQDVVDAYEQLAEANYLLSQIPFWSGRYEDAQTLIQGYEAESKMLEEVVVAQRLAMQAAVKSQNPPHPLSTWHQVRQIWEEAIAHLTQVPANSPVYTLAQFKLEEYEGNLRTIQQRVKIEQRAQELVQNGRETAKVAEAREGVATSLEDWQLVQNTWQAVIDQLQQVQKTTMAYAEAQQLLALYQPKLGATSDRLRQEETSTATYRQALNMASQAQSAERQSQWSRAVTSWEEAIAYAERVPNGTTQYDQVQPLIAAYRTSLGTAREKLRAAVAIQTAESQLAETCSGSPRVCTYNASGDMMQVRVTPGYDQALQQAAAVTQANTNQDAQSALMVHFDPLLQAIATIGENSQLKIELYNADGSLFGTYDPRLDGFVNEDNTRTR